MPECSAPVVPPSADAGRTADSTETDAADRLRVLFIQHCAVRNGSAISGQLVVKGFRDVGWTVDVAFGFDGPMIAEYEHLGCRTHVVLHKSWLRSTSMVRWLRHLIAEYSGSSAFRRLLREIRPDVVYINSLVSVAAAIASWKEGVPVVWHVRELFADVGGEMQVPRFGGRQFVRRILATYACQRVASSQIVLSDVLGTGMSRDVAVVPNAVSDDFFHVAETKSECRRKLCLPMDSTVIGVPGTLRPIKGHVWFFEAAAKICQEIPECVIAVTGTGEREYCDYLQSHVDTLGITENVRFLGTVRDMATFYRACDLICVPSQSESFGRTVIEAFAVGVAVVSTAVGGILETVTDGVTGVLVRFGDVPEMSNAVLQLLRDADRRDAMSFAAHEEAARRFSSAAHCGRLNEIVRRSASSRPLPARAGAE